MYESQETVCSPMSCIISHNHNLVFKFKKKFIEVILIVLSHYPNLCSDYVSGSIAYNDIGVDGGKMEMDHTALVE